MSKVVINLTQQSILQKIEQVLERYPDHLYQQAFAHPDTRQELLVWVLNRIPNLFTVLETCEASGGYSGRASFYHDDLSYMEFVIRQGIREIMTQEQPIIEHYLPEREDTQLAASHWFG
jgi:hypothetical protein